MAQNRGRKTYKTMQGKQIDIDLLRQKNELTPAVGNMNINARGDEIGPGGEIIRTREEVIRDQQQNSPMPDENPLSTEELQQKEKDLTDSWEDDETEPEWVEDSEGNFVRKDDNG